MSIDVRDRDVPASAISEVVDWFHHVDATFSTYKHDSPISRLGRGELSVDSATEEVRLVLELCERARIETGGAFDITAAVAPNGTRLDPSGLVKGWSVERAAEMLTRSGAANFCLNAGGDIALRGEPNPGEPWRVGIRHPDHPDKVATVVHAHGPLAVATSATYERGAHIVDPRTGQPTTEVASVTVVGPDLTVADVYATAVFVMGVEGLGWLMQHAPYGGYAITHDGVAYSTPEFDDHRAP